MSSSRSIPHKWAVLIAVGSSYFITVATTTVSVLALAAIAEDFNVTLRTVGWVVIIESLIVAALLLPLGRLADVVGRFRTLRVGIAVFGVGLILTGLSPTFGFLIAARVVTALGNTMVQAVGTGVLVGAFPASERGLALGGQTTAVAIGAAAGPFLGGLALDRLEWSTLFLVLAVPTAAVLFIASRGLGVEQTDDSSNGRVFDGRGALLAAGFITILVLTLNDPFGFGLGSPVTLAGAAAAVALLVGFIRTELSHPTPMLDLRVFQGSEFRRAVLIRVVSFTASTTILFLIPIFLLGVRQLSTSTVGSLIALFAVGMIAGAQVSGRLYDRVGPRWPIVVGLGCQIAVLVLLVFVGEESSVALVGVAIVGNGLGQGLWNVPANSMMMGAMPAEALGVGGAFTNVTRTVGNVVGQAGATAIVAGFMAARGFDIPLGDVAETAGADVAFIEGWQATSVVGVVITVVALAIAARTGTRPGSGADVGG